MEGSGYDPSANSAWEACCEAVVADSLSLGVGHDLYVGHGSSVMVGVIVRVAYCSVGGCGRCSRG